jgi:hypothetical protein
VGLAGLVSQVFRQKSNSKLGYIKYIHTVVLVIIAVILIFVLFLLSKQNVSKKKMVKRLKRT